MESREYDIILLGATGYTGKLTAEYITKTQPTNLKWAIAGRSASKLEDVTKTLKSLNSTRTTPDIITVNLSLPELEALVKRTRVIVNTVGPYHIYSTPVVQACAENGTHYLDVTGETAWVREMIEKFEATAKETGAIIIPEIGCESAPSDIAAYVAARLIRKVWDCGVMDVVATLHDLTSSGLSGGTLATILSILDHYPLRYLMETLNNPFILSPIAKRDYRLSKYPRPTSYHRNIFQRLAGVFTYQPLGILATNFTAPSNNAIVHRSAGLNPQIYGHNFTYEEYMSVSNRLSGMFLHVMINLFTVLLAIPIFRKIAKSKVTQPGSGPSAESGTKDVFELRCVAVAEQINNKPRKSLASFRFHGTVYALTAVTLAEGAVALLEQQDRLRKEYGAGFLTSACLGDLYVENLQKRGGVLINVEQMGDIGSK